jgi:tol-pal system protein YbgF
METNRPVAFLQYPIVRGGPADIETYTGIRIMKTRPLRDRGIVLLAALLAAGCAATGEQVPAKNSEALLPEIDVVQVREHANEALKLSQEAKLDVQVMNTKLLEMDNNLVLLSEEVASVSPARLEELETSLALVIEAIKELRTQIGSLDARPRASGRRGAPATFSPRSAASVLTGSEYAVYQKGLQVFDKRNYRKARELFEKTLKQFPDGDYTDRAQFWLAQCYYAETDYPKAINAFKKVLAYEGSTKADDAQLHLALCYLRMGKGDEAKERLDALITRFPGSEYVPRAKKYPAQLK